jgi:hypothetical protein
MTPLHPPKTPTERKAERLAKKQQKENERLERERRQAVDKITADTAKVKGIRKRKDQEEIAHPSGGRVN